MVIFFYHFVNIFSLTFLDRSSIMVIIKLEGQSHEQTESGKAKTSSSGAGGGKFNPGNLPNDRGC
jgi:hypothetical protein